MGDLDPVQSLFRHATETPGAPAVVTTRATVDYATLAGRVETAAEVFRKAGAGPDTVVAVHLSSDVDGVVSLLAVNAAGATVQPQPLPGRPNVSEASAAALVHVATSGSSGSTRLVRLTAGNVSAALNASRERLGNTAGDAWLLCLPLHHVAGLSVVWRSLACGGSVVALPKFDPGLVAAALAERATVASFVPTMLGRVLDVGRGFESVRWVLSGGAATSPGLIRRGREAGLLVLTSYGMTETGSQMATVAPAEVSDSLGTVGRPLAGMIASITVDSEIVVDGPAVSAGYAGEGRRTGPHHTGDLGTIDGEGRLIVFGRMDDAITTGGETVHPVTVETALESHPAVSAAVVYGLADAEWGERVAAVVEADGVEGAVLIGWLRTRLPRHEVPKEVRVVSALPRLTTGKVDRKSARTA